MAAALNLLLVLSIVTGAIYGVWSTKRPVSIFRTFVKTAAIASLAAYAALSGGPILLIAAFGLSALGDYFLSRDGDTPFLLGMAAFFAAHLAYIPLFLNLGLGGDLIMARWPVALVILVYAAVFYRILWPGLGSFRLPVAAYSLAIAVMGLAALSLPTAAAKGAILLGAASFILSDSILAIEKFRLPPTHPAARLTPYAVWFFYGLAQMLILFGSLNAT